MLARIPGAGRVHRSKRMDKLSPFCIVLALMLTSLGSWFPLDGWPSFPSILFQLFGVFKDILKYFILFWGLFAVLFCYFNGNRILFLIDFRKFVVNAGYRSLQIPSFTLFTLFIVKQMARIEKKNSKQKNLSMFLFWLALFMS